MEKTKSQWLDVLRTLATFSVVFLHVSAVLLTQSNHISYHDFVVGNIFDGAVRFCVPVFFMISGALLLSKEYPLDVYFKKRFIRIIPAFIVWSLIYILWQLYELHSIGRIFTAKEILNYTIDKLLTGSEYHMWFVYVLIGMYMFVPVLGKWIRNASQNEILYFLIVWWVILLFNYPVLENYQNIIELSNFSGYIGYLVLGYWLFHTKNTFFNKKWFGLILFIVGTVITIGATHLMTIHRGRLSENFYDYLTLNVMLSASGVFLLVKNVTIKNKAIALFTANVSKNGYGIYLGHVLVIKLMFRFLGFNLSISVDWLSIIIVSVVCFLLTMLLINFLNLIKLGKYLG